MKFLLNSKILNKRKLAHDNSFFKKGYTFLELVIAISILGVLMMVVIPSFSDFRQNSLLNGDTTNLITLINRARLLSVSNNEDSQYGVHFESTKATLFKGTYVVDTPSNEVVLFNNGISLSSISIDGGGSEILFEKVTGAASNTGDFTLSVSGVSKSVDIGVLASGVTTIQ